MNNIFMSIVNNTDIDTLKEYEYMIIDDEQIKISTIKDISIQFESVMKITQLGEHGLYITYRELGTVEKFVLIKGR